MKKELIDTIENTELVFGSNFIIHKSILMILYKEILEKNNDEALIILSKIASSVGFSDMFKELEEEYENKITR